MSATESEPQTELTRQVRHLQRTVRRLTIAVIALPALAFTIATDHARSDVVSASRFELIGTEGEIRAVLGVDEGSRTLALLDTAGRQRLTLLHDEIQTGKFALDEAGTVRLGASQFARGGGGFALHGPESSGAAVLYLESEGSLTFYGPEGAVLERVAPPEQETP